MIGQEELGTAEMRGQVDDIVRATKYSLAWRTRDLEVLKSSTLVH